MQGKRSQGRSWLELDLAQFLWRRAPGDGGVKPGHRAERRPDESSIEVFPSSSWYLFLLAHRQERGWYKETLNRKQRCYLPQPSSAQYLHCRSPSSAASSPPFDLVWSRPRRHQSSCRGPFPLPRVVFGSSGPLFKWRWRRDRTKLVRIN